MCGGTTRSCLPLEIRSADSGIAEVFDGDCMSGGTVRHIRPRPGDIQTAIRQILSPIDLLIVSSTVASVNTNRVVAGSLPIILMGSRGANKWQSLKVLAPTPSPQLSRLYSL